MQQLNENQSLDSRIIELAYAVFGNGLGAEFIKLLKEKYLMAPVYIPHLGDGHAHVREGENNLIRQFMTWIEVQEAKIKLSQQQKDKVK